LNHLLACAIALVLAPSTFAWYDKGNLVSTRLAWRWLSKDQRAKVVALLKKHPHYEEFLAARKPDGFTEKESAFMRAATWADWVWSHHEEQYDRPTRHYINHPIVPAGSTVDPAKHQPPAKQENVVNQLTVSVDKIRNGSEEERAIYPTWLFHLVGDIHQPLHCTAVYSERFPDWNKGGNLARIRIRSVPMNLHSFWGGLLGTGTTAGDIDKAVQEIEAVLESKAGDLRKELEAHQMFESWAREGEELSRRVVYLNGDLKVAAGRGGRARWAEDAPEAPADYAANCGCVAGVQVGKAGLRLADHLQKLFP
jgi:hypothetical protein